MASPQEGLGGFRQIQGEVGFGGEPPPDPIVLQPYLSIAGRRAETCMDFNVQTHN